MPKILPDDAPMRTSVRDKQLVEVPTIVSYSSLQRTVEQHVDTLVQFLVVTRVLGFADEHFE